MATTILTRYEGKCADCGTEIPIGSQARYYGRGTLYGLTCHEQKTPVKMPVKAKVRPVADNAAYAKKVISKYIGPPAAPAPAPVPHIGNGDPAKGPLYPSGMFHHGDHCPTNHRPTSYAYGWAYPNKKARTPEWRKLSRKVGYQRVPLCLEMLDACDGLTAMFQHTGRILCKGDPLGATTRFGVLTGGSNPLAIPIRLPAWAHHVGELGQALGQAFRIPDHGELKRALLAVAIDIRDSQKEAMPLAA